MNKLVKLIRDVAEQANALAQETGDDELSGNAAYLLAVIDLDYGSFDEVDETLMSLAERLQTLK